MIFLSTSLASESLNEDKKKLKLMNYIQERNHGENSVATYAMVGWIFLNWIHLYSPNTFSRTLTSTGSWTLQFQPHKRLQPRLLLRVNSSTSLLTETEKSCSIVFIFSSADDIFPLVTILVISRQPPFYFINFWPKLLPQCTPI